MSQPSQPSQPSETATTTKAPRQRPPQGPAASGGAEPIPATASAAISLTGTWIITDGPETFTLIFAPLLENTFHGRYTDAPDPSVFVAQLHTTARGTLLTMVQTSPERQYIAAYGAYRLPSGAFSGSWTDVDGNSAEFQLSRT